MRRWPFLAVIALLVAFVAWGVSLLLRARNGGDHPPSPQVWSPREAEAEEIARVLPSWAEALPETALDPASGLPTPVRDRRTSLVFALVPAGETVIGDVRSAGYVNEAAAFELARNERPRMRFAEPFYLGREEVTCGQLRRFLDDGDAAAVVDREALRELQEYPDDRPAVFVTRAEASAYARWAGGRLPSEAEWEYAAKGAVSDLLYPWGASRDPGDACLQVDVGPLLNADGVPLPARAMRACGTSLRDRSWCGVRDLAGNAAEWMGVPYRSYAGRSSADDEGIEELFRRYDAVIRGGSWATSIGAGRCTQRERLPDGERFDFVGFRVFRRP